MFFRPLLSLAFLPYLVTAVPGNDRCVNAFTLKEGESMMGDTTDANFDYNMRDICGYRSDLQAVWYQIWGTGKKVTVSVCSNNDRIADFGVFYNCNDQLCYANPPKQDELRSCDAGEAVSIKFIAEDRENYFVHVRAEWYDGVGGNFTIEYHTEPEDPQNVQNNNGGSGGGALVSTRSVIMAIAAAVLATAATRLCYYFGSFGLFRGKVSAHGKIPIFRESGVGK